MMNANKRVAAYLFAAVVLLGSTAPAFAQTTDAFATKDATEWAKLERQLVTSLDSPIAQVRQGALQHITFFATYHQDDVDLNEAVPKLIEIATDHPHVEIRKKAIFWLGDSEDPRAVEFIISLLK